MESQIEQLIKFSLVLILLTGGLLFWVIPKTRLRSKLKMSESLYVLIHITGIVCSTAGLFVTMIYPFQIIEYHLWELLIMPFVVVQIYWLMIMKVRKKEVLDEKQEFDMSKAGGYSFAFAVFAMSIIFILYQSEILAGMLWFPYFLFVSILFFSSTTLLLFKQG